MKRFFRVIGYVLLVVCFLGAGVHTFLYYRAGELFKAFIENTSGGVYSASSQKLRFGYFPFRIKASDVTFYPVDTSGLRRTYTIHADTVQLRLTSIIPFLFEKSLLVREVRLVRPMVQMESDLKKLPNGNLKFNIPIQEIQNGLLKSLDLLEVNRCDIIDGGFSLKRTDLNESFSVNHITLTIDSLIAARKGMVKQNGDSVNANLTLSIDKPDIEIPDSNYLVGLDRLYIDTKKNVFSIDELRFSRKKEKGAYDTVKLSSVELRGLDWELFLNEGVISLDTVQVKNGIARIDLTDRFIFQKRKDKKVDQPGRAPIPIFLKEVSIAQINYTLRSLRKTGPFTIRLDGDSLRLSSFALQNTARGPFSIGSLSLNVRNYNDQDDEKTYLAGFDRLLIRNDNLKIGNYRLYPLKNLAFSSNNRIEIPSLVLYNYDLASLLQGRLAADRLELVEPRLVLDILRKNEEQDKDKGEGLFKVLNNLQRTLDIRELSIKDASIVLQPRNNLADSITISQLNTELNVEKLLDATSVNDLFLVAEDIRSDGFFISGPRFDLQVTDALIVKGSEQVNIASLKGNIANILQVDLDSVSIRSRTGEFLIPVDGKLALESVNIGSGLVMVISEETADSAKRDKKPAPDVFIDNLRTGPLQLTYFRNNGSLFEVREVALEMQGLEAGRNKLKWQQLFLRGQSLVTTAGTQNISLGQWEGNVPGSFSLKGLKIWPVQQDISGVELDIPMLDFKNTVQSMVWDPQAVQDVKIYNPHINWKFLPHEKAETRINETFLKPVLLNSLTIIDPEVSGYRTTKTGQRRYAAMEKGEITLKDIDFFYTNPSQVRLSRLSANLFQPSIQMDSTWTLHPGLVRLLAGNVLWNKGDKQPSGFIDTVSVEGIGELPVFDKPGQTLSLRTAGIAGWTYPFAEDNLQNQLLYGPEWWLSGLNYNRRNEKNTLDIYNLNASRTNRMVYFDSLKMQPNTDRITFWAQDRFESDYITLKMGSTWFKNVRPVFLFDKDSGATIESITTDGLELMAARDKRYLDDTIAYRPLLARQLQQIPFNFRLDTLRVENGRVAYHEIGERYGREGYLTIDDMNGTAFNLFSSPPTQTDSIFLDVSGKFMNAAPMRIRFEQSYTDSLQSFLFNMNMGQWPMNAVNPLLVPLNSIAFKKGLADSMWLTAYANRYRAYGWIGFKYNKFALNILKNGTYGRYFGSGAINAASNLIVNNNNKGNGTPFYTERLVNKSTFNFWGRIMRAAVMGNVGMPGKQKSARKAMRKENIPAKTPRP